ncbi:MAG: winged helix-turn-helix domain-containing protein, partial [Deinococcus sp.]|nr:winged helix-turn-helix domain-containing protein [Deinococcus sp.]
MTDPTDLAARLAELERRVSALEGRETALTRTDTPTDEDPFWALNRLKTDFPDGALLYAGHVYLPTGEHWGWKEFEDTAALLQSDWEGAAPVLAALGHPLRLAILRAVLHGSRSTTELQADPGLAVGGKLYHHLRELQAAGWLLLQGRGQY